MLARYALAAALGSMLACPMRGRERETTRRIYAADWRTVEERNEVVLAQLAEAGIGQ